jgi:hypothetical protein
MKIRPENRCLGILGARAPNHGHQVGHIACFLSDTVDSSEILAAIRNLSPDFVLTGSPAPEPFVKAEDEARREKRGASATYDPPPIRLLTL